MVTDNKYRWDFIGLSTDAKPTPANSDRVVDGSTFYCSDTSKLYVFCKNQWYEKEATGGGTTYTAGANITIADGVISATDTTYNNFTGTDGTDVGAAGLVPAPAATDADKFLKSDGTWATAGGTGINVVQTIGASETDVMSQKATSDMVYADAGTNQFRIRIGKFAQANGDNCVAIGSGWNAGNPGAKAGQEAIAIGWTSEAAGRTIAIGNGAKTINSYNYSIAIGDSAQASANGSVALGKNAKATLAGEVNIGSFNSSYGYNSTNYRLLSGVYDAQNLHDAATLAQGNTLATAAPTTSTVGVLGQLYTDTTNMHTYQLTAIDTTDPNNPTYTWTQRW